MRLATLNDILMAWQGAQIGYRRALELAQIDTLGELYEAAILSGVEIRTFQTREELAMAEIVTDLIRQHAVPRIAPSPSQ